jgi:hypothetical protein
MRSSVVFDMPIETFATEGAEWLGGFGRLEVANTKIVSRPVKKILTYRTHRQGTLDILSLYWYKICSFSVESLERNREDGVIILDSVRHSGQFLFEPEATTSPDFPCGSRHCFIHCERKVRTDGE